MEYLTITKENNVAIIAINRPPANALSSQVLAELSCLLNEIEKDNDVRVILIRGSGRFFSAGADIKEFTTIESGADFAKLAQKGQETIEKIEQFPKPVIAAIHGAALGGGLELAMGCHIRLVSHEAKLGLPELQLGLIPGFGGTIRLPRLVGVAKATEMMLTSEPINGKDAVQWGLANASYSEEELLNSAKELAEKIAKKSPIALKATLEQLYFHKTNEFYKGIEAEKNRFGVIFDTDDAKEGIQAFLEKRKPHFHGR